MSDDKAKAKLEVQGKNTAPRTLAERLVTVEAENAALWQRNAALVGDLASGRLKDWRRLNDDLLWISDHYPDVFEALREARPFAGQLIQWT